MFDDIVKKDDEEIELELENTEPEEKYEICPDCENIIIEGEDCDCEKGCGCAGTSCKKC